MSFTLSDKYYEFECVLGQGNFGTSNNWWFGGYGWTAIGGSAVSFQQTSPIDELIEVGFRVGTDVNDFYMVVKQAQNLLNIIYKKL